MSQVIRDLKRVISLTHYTLTHEGNCKKGQIALRDNYPLRVQHVPPVMMPK